MHLLQSAVGVEQGFALFLVSFCLQGELTKTTLQTMLNSPPLVPGPRPKPVSAVDRFVMNKNVAEAARRIFGNLPHSQGRSGNKALRKNIIGHKIAEYYPQSTAPDMVNMAEKNIPGVVMNHKREWRQWKRDLDAGRGVYSAKKGQGKRSK